MGHVCIGSSKVDENEFISVISTASTIWAERYAEDPESFEEILDDDGNVVDDYGLACAKYLKSILDEL